MKRPALVKAFFFFFITSIFVRELVEAKRINVPFVNSVDNLADFFTKPLDARVFYPMRDRIMNVKHPSDGDGAVPLV